MTTDDDRDSPTLRERFQKRSCHPDRCFQRASVVLSPCFVSFLCPNDLRRWRCWRSRWWRPPEPAPSRTRSPVGTFAHEQLTEEPLEVQNTVWSKTTGEVRVRQAVDAAGLWSNVLPLRRRSPLSVATSRPFNFRHRCNKSRITSVTAVVSLPSTFVTALASLQLAILYLPTILP
jgi:hypothetical protein